MNFFCSLIEFTPQQDISNNADDFVKLKYAKKQPSEQEIERQRAIVREAQRIRTEQTRLKMREIQFRDDLGKGLVLIKIDRHNHHGYRLLFSPDMGETLCWKEAPGFSNRRSLNPFNLKKTKIPSLMIRDIREVVSSTQHECAFNLVFPNRTLKLIASSRNERNLLIEGFTILKQAEREKMLQNPQLSKQDSNYSYENTSVLSMKSYEECESVISNPTRLTFRSSSSSV